LPLLYELPASSGELRQGELLQNIWEFRPTVPATKHDPSPPVAFQVITHSKMIVMTADCDLVQDHATRFPQAWHAIEGEADPKLLPQILMCDLFTEDEIHSQMPGSDVWKRVKKNQDERYHCLAAADVGTPAVNSLPALYMDFKKAIGLPTTAIYQGLAVPHGISRIAVVPPTYIHDLIHRFFGFLSRVGVPD
jgi:hypothetical protein